MKGKASLLGGHPLKDGPLGRSSIAQGAFMVEDRAATDCGEEQQEAERHQ